MVKQMEHHSFSLSRTGNWWRDDNAVYISPIFRPDEWVVFTSSFLCGKLFPSLDSALSYADTCDLEV